MKFPRPRQAPAWLTFYGLVAMVAMLPLMASWIGNRYQVSAQDLLVPTLLALMTAGIITAVFMRLWRRDHPAAYLAATLSALILASNYDTRISSLSTLFDAFAPLSGLSAGPILAVVCAGFVFALAAWAGRAFGHLVNRRGWNVKDVSTGMVLAIGATFGFMLVTIGHDLAVEWPQFFYRPNQLASLPAGAASKDKPDIYYIVLDRYASDDVLKKQFDFDNSDFSNFLKEQGYYINPSAHNNYPYTTMSIASTMQADYLNDIVNRFGKSSEQTVIPFNETIRQSPVAAALKSIGYQYNLVGNWYETSNTSPIADTEYLQAGQLTILGHTFTLNNFDKLYMMQSPFSRFIQLNMSIGSFKILTYTNLGDVEQAHYQLDSLKHLASAPAGGRFVFAHILIPHEPYTFNADGSLSANSSNDNIGQPLKQKYLGQVKFINSEMKSILTAINKRSDGKSVVVLQADEGPYPFLLTDQAFSTKSEDGELQLGDMRKWTDAALQMKMGNQAAYHVPEVDFAKDAEVADSVNIFRLILNTYFGAGYEYRPDCYYVYPNGREQPERFADVTSRLTEAPKDSRCQENGTSKQ